MLHTLLQHVGFDSSEARVYLTCLKLGTQDLMMISKESGLPRYDTQTILNRLSEFGFVSRFDSKKPFYTAEPLKVVLKILEHKREGSQKELEALKEKLPELERYLNPDFTKPQISFYEGREGVIAAYEDTLTSKGDILAWASIEDTESIFPRYVPRYYQRRKAAGILIKAIFPDTPMSRKRQAQDLNELRQSRLVPSEMYDFNIEINIYDDKVAYFAIKELMAVIIQSSSIADSMRTIFNICWNMAEIYETSRLPKKPNRQDSSGLNL